jgi:hypothetical protein
MGLDLVVLRTSDELDARNFAGAEIFLDIANRLDMGHAVPDSSGPFHDRDIDLAALHEETHRIMLTPIGVVHEKTDRTSLFRYPFGTSCRRPSGATDPRRLDPNIAHPFIRNNRASGIADRPSIIVEASSDVDFAADDVIATRVHFPISPTF